ncbi:DUF1080 domain-containing protein [Akkermansiaceae bacterium]|nr:DUF1080 domain-containing protein [Akkermansiaceae bacterium]
MKYVLSIITAITIGGNLSAEEGFKALFNGRDLSGWKSTREQAEKGAGKFFVDPNEKTIHTYLGKEAGSQQGTDCLYSDKEYTNFVLKLEYKWLDKRFAPRVALDRDAGLLFHLHGNLTKIWPNSVEMQLGESDAKKIKKRYTTGDLWVLGKDIQVMTPRDINSFYAAEGDSIVVGKDRGYDRSFTPVAHEKAHGQWNEITLTVRGGKEAIFELNGNVVNRISNMTYLVDGKRVPLKSGRIGLQAEYAELVYRNILIKELSPTEGLAD